MLRKFLQNKLLLASALILFACISTTTVVNANGFTNIVSSIWNFIFGSSTTPPTEPVVPPTPVVHDTNIPITSSNTVIIPPTSTHSSITLTDQELYDALSKLNKLPDNIIRQLRGPQGLQGPQGPAGTSGSSSSSGITYVSGGVSGSGRSSNSNPNLWHKTAGGTVYNNSNQVAVGTNTLSGNATLQVQAQADTLGSEQTTNGDFASQYGSEEITNGNFSSNADSWDLGDGWTYDADQKNVKLTPLTTGSMNTISVANGGSGYTTGCGVSVSGGTDGTICIDTVDGDGAVTSVETDNTGSGYAVGTQTTTASRDFVGLNQTGRNWYGVTVAPNGNVYAADHGGDIYMQTGGVGDFEPLGQTNRQWFGMTASSNGNVYAVVVVGDIYMQTGGVGDFEPLGQTSRNWTTMTIAPNGNVYAAVNNGDIYMQTGGVGDFEPLSQTSRQWYGLAGAPNGNVYASDFGGDIYMQTGGVGDFEPLSQAGSHWFGMTASPNGNIYAASDFGQIYMQTNGVGSFVSLDQTSREWLQLTASPNGNVYATTLSGSGDIYMQNNNSTGLTISIDSINPDSGGSLSQSGTLTEGVPYKVTLDVGGTEGGVNVALDGCYNSTIGAGEGVVTFTGYWCNDAGNKLNIIPSSDFNGTIDSVSVKSIVWQSDTGWTINGGTAIHTKSQGIAGNDGLDSNGSDYQVGDVLTIDGGNHNATITVTATDGDPGPIDGYDFTTGGTGYTVGCYNLTGGQGSGGVFCVSISDPNTGQLHQPGVLQDGQKYKVSFHITGTAGTVTSYLCDCEGYSFDAGTGDVSFTATYLNNDDNFLTFAPTGDFNGSISNVSVKLATTNAAQTWKDASGNNLLTITSSGSNQSQINFTIPNSSNYIALRAPASLDDGNIIWTLPDADSAGCLKSNGGGTLYIDTCGGSLPSSFNDSNTMSGTESTAFGYGNIASGTHSIAIGYTNTAIGIEAISFGRSNYATGYDSLAIGNGTSADGYASVALGYADHSTGSASSAMGTFMTVSGVESFGIGLSNDSYTVSADHVMAIMGGNVGVGTTNPQAALDVAGAENPLILRSNTTQNWMAFNNSNGYIGYMGVFNGAENGDIDFGTGEGNTTGTVHLVTSAIPRLNITPDGNVGIGTTDPGASLPNGMPAGSRILQITSPNTSTAEGIQLRRGGDGNTGLDIWDYSYGTYIDSFSDDDAVGLNFRMKTQGTPVTAMTIKGTGNVGIGTTSPSTKLNIEGDSAVSPQVYPTTNGIFRIGAPDTNHVVLDFGILHDNPWTTWIQAGETTGSGHFPISLNPLGGNVGIGNTTPSVALDVTGDIEYTGTITDVSDKRLKENITDYTGALDVISQLQAKSYNMIISPDRPETGFIAQDVQQIFPQAVSIIDPTKGYLGVSYVSLVPVIAEAVKELNLKVDNLVTIPTDGSENSFLAKIAEWLGSVENNIAKIFVGEVDTKKICVSDDTGSTCITKSQLDSLLQNSSVTPPPATPPTPDPVPPTTPTPPASDPGVVTPPPAPDPQTPPPAETPPTETPPAPDVQTPPADTPPAQ